MSLAAPHKQCASSHVCAVCFSLGSTVRPPDCACPTCLRVGSARARNLHARRSDRYTVYRVVYTTTSLHRSNPKNTIHCQMCSVLSTQYVLTRTCAPPSVLERHVTIRESSSIAILIYSSIAGFLLFVSRVERVEQAVCLLHAYSADKLEPLHQSRPEVRRRASVPRMYRPEYPLPTKRQIDG